MRDTSQRRRLAVGTSLLVCTWCFAIGNFPSAHAQEILIPRKQTKPPNKPYTAAEAAARMKVPDGFTVEVVAAEPDLVNPVAMTFDERGRVWVTESVEYPRKPAGPGKDRVKILSDEDGDGTYETVKIFAEGLNIPSGIAVGYGGVWVANAPDILFYPDKNRDDVPDGPPQVVVTGFGRADTHELPNSLTWGPDGYLYGLNGVFNASKIVQNGKTFEFTCAMFRIHPRTREFSLFCEGTSNPWGIAFNDVGDAFVSACVIDHLWHLVETGYYHRQGGPYPPFTWKLGSIVDYKHQMAAYCGLHWFDSDAYPEQYRKKLYMGNLHGSAINCDRLEKHGATYKGRPEGDFLTADDVWFMPVAQKTGPDGCLYILDWYDRYHCYQDANADPAGVDRLKGRLYRVRYQDTPRAKPFDLTQETDEQLIERLKSPNLYYRDLAQRLLAERNAPATRPKLEKIVGDDTAPRTFRMHALWTLISADALEPGFHLILLTDHISFYPAIRAWAARAAGNARSHSPDIRKAVKALVSANSNPELILQGAIASRKLSGDESAVLLLEAAGTAANSSELLPPIAWQNLLPMLDNKFDDLLAAIDENNPNNSQTKTMLLREKGITFLMPRLLDWQLARGEEGARQVVVLADYFIIRATSRNVAKPKYFTDALANRVTTGGVTPLQSKILQQHLLPSLLERCKRYPNDESTPSALAILSSWKDAYAIGQMKQFCLTTDAPEKDRLLALDAWASSADRELVSSLHKILPPSSMNSATFRRRVFDLLTQYDEPAVAANVLSVYPDLETELKPAAVELLTSRVAWSNALIDAITAGKLSKDDVNVTQIAKLLKSQDKTLAARVEQTWGKLRTDRNPQRAQVVADMKKLLSGSAGNPLKGQVVYMKLCGQCHKLHGSGQDVGPDITVNGRASFEQLVNNVFDPSLVIGNAYQARTVVTSDGRVLTGLLVEDNPQRVVLKLQGGKLETIARGDVEEMEVSKLSLMPEGVEKQLTPQELIDLFALLKLDKSPTDPQSKPLPNFSELK